MSLANKLNSKRAAAVISFALRGAGPALCGMAALTVPGCIFGSPGASNVALGEQYTAGDGNYDEFFSQLFLVQLQMGKAPDREEAIRTRLAGAAGLPETASTDVILSTIETHVAKLAMSGTSMKVSASGLDGTGAVNAKVVTVGQLSNPKDVAFISEVGQAVADAAALVTDMRAAKPKIEALRDQPASLEPGVEETFHRGGSPKKAEVRKNLHDANTLLPLMSTRATDVEHQTIDLLKKLEHAMGLAPQQPAAAEPEPAPLATPSATPKKKSAPKPAASPAEPSSDEPKPAAAPKPKPKPAAPPADDFEP